MDAYYSELATSALNDTIKRIVDAQQYLNRSGTAFDKQMIAKLNRVKNNINNRISEIISEPKTER